MKVIRVREIETRKIVREIDCSNQSPRAIEKVLSGIIRQMNQDKFFACEEAK